MRDAALHLRREYSDICELAMNTDEKLDLLLEMVADIYSLAEKLAPKVGLELMRPAGMQVFLDAQQAKR